MNENWAALLIAILKRCTPERAFLAYRGQLRNRTSKEEVERMIAMRAEGKKYKEIAEEFGVSEYTINSRIQYYKKTGGMYKHGRKKERTL